MSSYQSLTTFAMSQSRALLAVRPDAVIFHRRCATAVAERFVARSFADRTFIWLPRSRHSHVSSALEQFEGQPLFDTPD